jgi:hypothetical protein
MITMQFANESDHTGSQMPLHPRQLPKAVQISRQCVSSITWQSPLISSAGMCVSGIGDACLLYARQLLSRCPLAASRSRLPPWRSHACGVLVRKRNPSAEEEYLCNERLQGPANPRNTCVLFLSSPYPEGVGASAVAGKVHSIYVRRTLV